MTPSTSAEETFSASIPYSKRQSVTHFVTGTQVKQKEERNKHFRTSRDVRFMMKLTSYNTMLLHLISASYASVGLGTEILQLCEIFSKTN